MIIMYELINNGCWLIGESYRGEPDEAGFSPKKRLEEETVDVCFAANDPTFTEGMLLSTLRQENCYFFHLKKELNYLVICIF